MNQSNQIILEKCFFCQKPGELFNKLKPFDFKKLELCSKVLEIRKENTWFHDDIEVPSGIGGSYYHSDCYKTFIKISGKTKDSPKNICGNNSMNSSEDSTNNRYTSPNILLNH